MDKHLILIKVSSNYTEFQEFKYIKKFDRKNTHLIFDGELISEKNQEDGNPLKVKEAIINLVELLMLLDK
ncbi:hypothetical protein NPD5_2603 [Clostridium sporogenes]|uniref:Uncharacterized protein n=1 Tax=Clostridium sporogenes TaxID=1509 RepID=A0A1L3NIP1_CLOSG|nr:hypothetical protein [Clostridium sporogenes]APH16005.1 hypothetical protein NPD5_2603 [Clostridium sporogenes]